MSEVQLHVHRPNVVANMGYDGSEEARHELARWVVANGGQAKVHLDHLLVKTQLKWAIIPPDYRVGLGVVGQFWAISADVHALSYDPVDGGYGADYRLGEDQLRLLRTEAHETADVERLREIVDVVVAAAVA